MAAQGKMLVLGNILKLDRPFRPPQIVDMSGLDRQLVRYHLAKLCETGYLEKIDKHYVIKDREGLLTTLLEETDNVETAKPGPAGFISKETIDKWNAQAEIFIASRTLDLPMSSEARQGMLDDIDNTIKLFKQLRKYLTNSTKTKGSAQKFFKGLGDRDTVEEAIWKIMVSYIQADITVDLPEFSDALREALIESDGTG